MSTTEGYNRGVSCPLMKVYNRGVSCPLMKVITGVSCPLQNVTTEVCHVHYRRL
jgi:hypothetical protein